MTRNAISLGKTNVIILGIDQYRYDIFMRSEVARAFISRGVFLDKCYTYAPYTLASLHAIFSGIYGFKNGVNAYYAAKQFKYDKYTTIFDFFKKNGYVTYFNTVNDMLVPAQGIDHKSIYDEYGTDVLEMHKEILRGAFENESDSPIFVFLHNLTIHKNTISEVVDVFKEDDKNFFGKIYLNTNRYLKFTAVVDNYIEKLMDFISEFDKDNNTLVILLTDHGCSLGERVGEKAYGVFCYDYTIRTWALFLHPSLIPRVIEYQTRTIDIYPTILSLFGCKNEIFVQQMDGKPIYFDRDNPRTVYCETGGLTGPNPSPYVPNILCLRTKDNWKLIHNTTTKENELYNLNNDLTEEINLANSFKNKVIKFLIKLRRIRGQMK